MMFAEHFHIEDSVPTMGSLKDPFPSDPITGKIVTGWPGVGEQDQNGKIRTTTGHLQSDERAIYHDHVLTGVHSRDDLQYYGDDDQDVYGYTIAKQAAIDMNAQMEASKAIYQGSQWPREEIEYLAPFGTRHIGVFSPLSDNPAHDTGGEITYTQGSGLDYTGFPGDPNNGPVGQERPPYDMEEDSSIYMNRADAYSETYVTERVAVHVDMVPEPIHVETGSNVKVATAGVPNPYENIYKYGIGTYADEPNPRNGKPLLSNLAADPQLVTVWQYQQQFWPRVEALIKSEARMHQQIQSAQAAENAAAVAGTARHNEAYSTGNYNGHTRLESPDIPGEGYYGEDDKKNTYPESSGNAIQRPMTALSNHPYNFLSREAAKFAYMGTAFVHPVTALRVAADGFLGEGCFPASTSTSYRLEYESSSDSPTLASQHRADQGGGLMAGNAWFANELYTAAGGTYEWYQIGLQHISLVEGVTTAGATLADGTAYWVTSYKLRYSLDRQTWTTFLDQDNFEKVFTGNADSTTPVTNHLLPGPEPTLGAYNASTPARVEGKFWRVYPQTWHGDRIGLRVELTRCVTCGDGYFDPSEGCDDGNIASGDGCSHLCWKESEDQEDQPGVNWCIPARETAQCVQRPRPQPTFYDDEGAAAGTQGDYVDVRRSDTYTYNTPYFFPDDRPSRTPDIRRRDVQADATVWGSVTLVNGRGHR